MVNIYSQNYQANNCNTRAYFGFDGNKAEYCVSNRLEGMVNVKSKRCDHNNCSIQPPTYCVAHRLPGMICVTSSNKNKQCKYAECVKIRSFGFKNCKTEYCFVHCLNGMFNVNSKRCQQDECNKEPSFGFEGG